MHAELLGKLGLSPNEAKCYEALLMLGESSVQMISLKSGVHRRNVYDTLEKLMAHGLVSRVFVHYEKRFRPLHPRRLFEMLKEKESALTAIFPQLEQDYVSKGETEEAYLYRGIEGFKNYLQDILTTRETVYFIGAKAFWLDPRLQHFLPRFQKERKRLGIQFMHLFDYEIRQQKPEILPIVGKPYKFLPKGYSSSTAVDVFGDYVVTFVGAEPGKLTDDPLQFVMKSRRLADGYRTFFRFMWDNSLSSEVGCGRLRT